MQQKHIFPLLKGLGNLSRDVAVDCRNAFSEIEGGLD
jgi:hypothetical protein